MKSSAELHSLLAVAIAALFSASVALGQEQAPPSQGPGPGGAPSAPSTPSPGREPRQPTPFPDTRDRGQQPPFGQERQQFPEMQRPIFLSGKVMLDDGTPPPDSVVIERVCNGIVRPEAYTDSKGRFSFQLGQNTNVMADASVSSTAADPSFGGGGFDNPRGGFGNTRGISERDLIGCELRASLPGYRSEVVNLTGRRVMDNPDVGTIILRRLGNVEGLTISATSLQAPKDARKAFDNGRKEAGKQKWDKAQKEFEKAVGLYPKYAAAWFELGRVYEQQKQVDPARSAYAKSLEADSKFVNPYLQIALMDARENKWQDVADTTDRVLKLNPYDFPAAYFYNSVANYNLQKLDAAERSAREAIKLNAHQRIPKVEHLLGIILAQKNSYEEAATHMRNYLQLSPEAADAALVKKQISELERFLGKSEVVQTAPN